MKESKIKQAKQKLLLYSRLGILSKETVVYKEHILSNTEKYILKNFGDKPIKEIMHNTGRSRAGIYRIVDSFKNLFTKDEIQPKRYVRK